MNRQGIAGNFTVSGEWSACVLILVEDDKTTISCQVYQHLSYLCCTCAQHMVEAPLVPSQLSHGIWQISVVSEQRGYLLG